MKTFEINISQRKVFDEVSKTTGMVGYKMIAADENAYDRIATTEADDEMLERFWDEACAVISSQIKPFLQAVTYHPNYNAQLCVADLFNDQTIAGIEASMFSVFVLTIVSKWFRMTNKEEAEVYANQVAGILAEITGNLYHRQRPKRESHEI